MVSRLFTQGRHRNASVILSKGRYNTDISQNVQYLALLELKQAGIIEERLLDKNRAHFMNAYNKETENHLDTWMDNGGNFYFASGDGKIYSSTNYGVYVYDLPVGVQGPLRSGKRQWKCSALRQPTSKWCTQQSSTPLTPIIYADIIISDNFYLNFVGIMNAEV